MTAKSLVQALTIGAGLSMDAAAVSVSDSMIYKDEGKLRLASVCISFGAFQAIMPLIGYFIGSVFVKYIQQYANIVVFAVLCLLGINMIVSSIKENKDPATVTVYRHLSLKLIFLQAIATSTDALAAGVCFCAEGMSVGELLASCGVIGTTTLVISAICVLAGRKFGYKLGSKAGIAGGALLIVTAVLSAFDIL